ncbi:MAG TPA: hypothetical protein VF316_16440 [Polyangiaceae bacterium]
MAEYALVVYRTGGEGALAPPKVEISGTPSYDTRRGQLTSAAIRLPDTCLNQGASQGSGVAHATESVLQTQCGFFLAEIERALAKQGFRVVSWDALCQLEHQKNLSTYDAARELKADVVFVFNSLEAGLTKAGSKTGVSFKYFHSDARGKRGSALALDDGTRQSFRDFAIKNAGAINKGAVSALSATLDTTAVLTDSGESIWFYRRTMTRPTKAASGVKLLFGRAGGLGTWQPARPIDTQIAANPISRLSTEDVSETQVDAQNDDPDKAEKLELIRMNAEDFVVSFRSGTGVQPK